MCSLLCGGLVFFNRWMLVQQNQLLQKNRSVKSREACFCLFFSEERKKKSWLWPCFQKRWGTNYLKWRKNKYCFFDVAINSLFPEASWKFLISSTRFWTRALGCWKELDTTCNRAHLHSCLYYCSEMLDVANREFHRYRKKGNILRFKSNLNKI